MMTTDDAARLEAGPALDAEIARRVLGAKRLYCRYGEDWTPEMRMEPSDRVFYIPSGKSWKTHRMDAIPLPRYSTDIAAAWAVVERLREIGLGVVIGSEPDGWEVEILTTEALYQQGYRGCYSKYAPIAEAICRAALRALQAGGEGQG